MANYDSNYAIAQEISARIGVSPIPFDSVYSIALEIYNELGGEPAEFDSVYSILLGILPLVEGGVASKVIEDASVLPDASENKSKLIRLESDDNVYVSELKSRTSTITNRLPDEQQIDKAYLYDTDDNSISYYKGAYHIVCNDGETNGYMWYQEGYLIITLKNAETITNSDNRSTYYAVDGVIASIDEITRTITIAVDVSALSSQVFGENMFLIPEIYNAPESAQIGNACVYSDDNFQFVYTGEEETIEVDGESINVYKWYNDDEEILKYSTKRASEIYYSSVVTPEGNLVISDTIFYMSDGAPDSAYDAYIPQLNAPDSEQVDNAYIEYGVPYKYKGDTLCTIIDVKNEKTYTGYKWETDDNELMVFTSLKASEIYGQTTTTIYMDGDGNDNWDDLGNNTYEATFLYVGTIKKMADSYSTVKYQRTEVTEEWDWQPLTDNATNDDIDAMFNSESPVVKRVLMKYGRVDEETGVRYPLTILEGLVNVSGETMEYEGQTYYKWVKYEDKGNGVSEPDIIHLDNDDEVIVLTTSLNPSLPFTSSSPEWAYMIGSITEDTSIYASPSNETYPKEALIHEDGSITYEE